MGFNLGILISGRGSNMLNIVNASQSGIINSKVKIVISNKINSQGIKKAKKKNIKTKIINQSLYKTKTNFEKVLNNSLIDENVNFICLAGFMSILSPYFLNLWSNKIINIHPSLLPDFKGKNAVKQALEKKVKTAGCTVHFVDEGVDTGKIIDQEKVTISNNDDEEMLAKKILKKEHVLYIKVLKELERKLL
ncbi:MAG: phosphoribosylglycinamide formyltransferase [Alphaproteobacteria bacterium]|nr:phosphoribosylglycinamide formyltransferase [Alphaproteobacteria bacterium]|tara:strand:- start:1162 stop:1737 length:576 start_codon:yes stop_codon:yes gene_type:complete